MSVKMLFNTQDIQVETNPEYVQSLINRLEADKQYRATRQLALSKSSLEEKLRKAAKRREE
jgi:hypothetical protein